MTTQRTPTPVEVPPWVRGFEQAVLADLEGGLDGVTRMRDRMGPDWDPIPSYEFHIALAKSRLRAIHPPVSGGDAAPSTHNSSAPTGPALPEQRGAAS